MIEAGKSYGKLTAIEETGVVRKRDKEWLFECECGAREARWESSVRRSARQGKTSMCRKCISQWHKANPPDHTSHGMYGTHMYNVWSNMKSRCCNTNSDDYHRYGGRGITVCERWMKFENFYADMKDGYMEGLQLDRINNNAGYYKENCRWATRSENARNRRDSLEIDPKELSNKSGISYNVIRGRVERGWPVDMLTIPPSPSNSRLRINGKHHYKRKYEEV